MTIPESVADCFASLERAARAACMAITADGRISEADAATLIGVAPKTLRNWRSTSAPIPWFRIAGRVTYRLADLAEHIEQGRGANSFPHLPWSAQTRPNPPRRSVALPPRFTASTLTGRVNHDPAPSAQTRRHR